MPRLAVPALLAVVTAGCPSPRNPFGPPVDPPAAPAAPIGFGLGSAGNDQVRDVAVDASGNIYVVGQFAGSVDFDPSTAAAVLSSLGGEDVFVARYSPVGALTWAIQLGGPADDAVHGLVLDQLGNLMIGGAFLGTADLDPGAGITAFTSNGGRDAWIASYSPAGVLRWARGFGNAGDDAILDVAAGTDGTVVTVGTFSGTMAVDPGQGIAVVSAGGTDGFVASWSGAGAARWAFSVGGEGSDAARAVGPGPSGALFVGGSFTSSADFAPGTATSGLTSLGGSDAFLARFTDTGALTWVRGFGGTLDDAVSQGGLAVGSSGFIYATGEFAGTADFDASSLADGRTSSGLSDIFLVQYTAGGDFGWVVAAGGTGTETAAGVIVGAGGEVTITGGFEADARFDPGVGATFLRAQGTGGASDLFLAQYGPTGSFRWAVGVGAPLTGASSRTSGAAVAAHGSGDVVVGGRFFGSADLDPGSALAVLISLGGADGLVARYTAAGVLARRP